MDGHDGDVVAGGSVAAKGRQVFKTDIDHVPRPASSLTERCFPEAVAAVHLAAGVPGF